MLNPLGHHNKCPSCILKVQCRLEAFEVGLLILKSTTLLKVSSKFCVSFWPFGADKVLWNFHTDHPVNATRSNVSCSMLWTELNHCRICCRVWMFLRISEYLRISHWTLIHSDTGTVSAAHLVQEDHHGSSLRFEIMFAWLGEETGCHPGSRSRSR